MNIDEEEARRPMGLTKKQHIQASSCESYALHSLGNQCLVAAEVLVGAPFSPLGRNRHLRCETSIQCAEHRAGRRAMGLPAACAKSHSILVAYSFLIFRVIRTYQVLA